MKMAIFNIFLLSMVVFSISTGCVSKKAITEDFINCLISESDAVEKKLGSDLKIIDQNLYATDEKLFNLDQVIVPAQTWVENQQAKLLEEYKYGSWHSQVTSQDLTKFRNKDYEISGLEVLVYGIGTPDQDLKTVIRVTDLDTNIQSEWETIKQQLEWKKSLLEKDRQAMVEKGQLSLTTLLSVTGHLADWKVENIDSNTCRISGPGLGMAGELSYGSWTYNRVSEEIVPVDDPSSVLYSILFPRF